MRGLGKSVLLVLLAVPAGILWAEGPTDYQPLNPEAAQATLEDIQAKAAQGALTPEAILEAARKLHQAGYVETAPARAPSADTYALAPAIPMRSPAVTSPVLSRQTLTYQRTGMDHAIEVSGPVNLLSPSAWERLKSELDRHGADYLAGVKRIEILPSQQDDRFGEKTVEDAPGVIRIYWGQPLAETLALGLASEMVDYGMTADEKAVALASDGREGFIFDYAERFSNN